MKLLEVSAPLKKRPKTPSEIDFNVCLACDFKTDELDPNYLLEEWKLCPKHKLETEEKLKMDCSVCGSQDTTPVSGTSKKTGQPWKAYDCNEKECKNEKGYPSRTFVPTPRGTFKKSFSKPSGGSDQSTLILKKLDLIIKALNIKETVKEEESPF